MHTIHVAGPVLRPDVEPIPDLPNFYERLTATAARTDVAVHLPTYDKELDTLEATDFARAIWNRIREADSLLALLDVPGSSPGSNLSVAGEAHWAAAFGKPVVIVAGDPEKVPRLIRALSPFKIHGWQRVNFDTVFRDLREATNRPRQERF